MPAFNFQAMFADAVANGSKRQTIRAKRKNRPRVGQMAHCYSGMRTRNCRRLGEWKIVSVMHVRIDDAGVLLDGAAVRAVELDTFARADGFENWERMLNWFRNAHGLPFHGDLVMWKIGVKTKLCDEDCNNCPLVLHENSRILTVLLNRLYKRFGNEVYVMVETMCPNLTVCFDCRIDDFCHVENCKLEQVI